MRSMFCLLFCLLAGTASAGFTITAYTGSYYGVDGGRVNVNYQFWHIPGPIEDGVPYVLNEHTAPSYGFDWNRLSTELQSRDNYYLGVGIVGGMGGGGAFDSHNYGFGPRDYPGLYVGSVVYTAKVDYTYPGPEFGSYLTRVWADMNLVPEPDGLLMMVCMAVILVCMWRIER